MLIPQVIKTDKVLSTIVKKVQKTEVSYKNIVPLSVSVEKIDDKVSKYVTVMESKGVKKQIVNFYYSETQ